jgi:hypothetical protein
MLVRVLHSLILFPLVTSALVTPTVDITYLAPRLSDDAHVAEQVAVLSTGRHCTPESEPRLVDYVIVHFTGTPVVAVRSLADAHRLATERKIKVKAYCDPKK